MDKQDIKVVNFPPFLKNRAFTIFLIFVSFVLAIVEIFYLRSFSVSSWDVVFYLTLLLPLIYLILKKEIVNRFTKWLIPFALIFIFDSFYYNNNLTIYFLPYITTIFIVLLYLSSMNKIDNFYQLFTPKVFTPFKPLSLSKSFFDNIFTIKRNEELTERLIKAILITLPFVVIFTLLLTSADSQYSKFLSNLFTLKVDFNFTNLIKTPIYALLFLVIFIYSFSNLGDRESISKKYKLDGFVVGFFLLTINLLFLSFVALQIPFLLKAEVPNGVNIANFAREGFFQLMLVVSIVAVILLFIFKRFNGERAILLLVGALILQSITMATVSIKKMHLYQELKGATVLRYYVEWFDYFLVAILLISLIFFIKRLNYEKLLNIIATIALLSFTVIASLNIDAMVAKANILKFKDTPNKLDKSYLFRLSIDALPIIKKYNIKHPKEVSPYWYNSTNYATCKDFTNYHYGYCKIVKEFKL